MPKLQAFAKRLGWSFKWLSSGGTDFNYDYNVSFKPEERRQGPGALQLRADRDDHVRPAGNQRILQGCRAGSVFHTYSCYARGLDMLNNAYHYLDLVPKGRDEAGLPHTMAWVKFRDLYGR